MKVATAYPNAFHGITEEIALRRSVQRMVPQRKVALEVGIAPRFAARALVS
ncbi:MAG: hypothetical protein ACLRTQ_08615 [Candidatus Borkfalkia sp.]